MKLNHVRKINTFADWNSPFTIPRNSKFRNVVDDKIQILGFSCSSEKLNASRQNTWHICDQQPRITLKSYQIYEIKFWMLLSPEIHVFFLSKNENQSINVKSDTILLHINFQISRCSFIQALSFGQSSWYNQNVLDGSPSACRQSNSAVYA